MGRCEFKHNLLDDATPEDSWRCDHTEGNWQPEVTAFLIDGQTTHRCLLHAPHDQEPTDRRPWPLAQRGQQQSVHLKNLIDAWNTHNAARTAPEGRKLAPLELLLPGIQCGEIDLDNTTFSGEVDFTEATFGGNADFNEVTFSGNANFIKATFSGEVDFTQATFSGDIAFSRAKFSGDIAFSRAKFSGFATFTQATFGGYAAFRRAKFSSEAYFSQAKFSDNANFSEAKFRGIAYFNTISFDGPTYFTQAVFLASLNLDGTVFSKQAAFDGAAFHHLKLLRITFKFPAHLTRCNIHHLSYSPHLGERLTFDNCRTIRHRGKKTVGFKFENPDLGRLAFHNMDLADVALLGTDIADTRFISCAWKRNDGYMQVPEHAHTMGDGDAKQLDRLEGLYRALKRNLEEAKEYAQAGDFHFREMQVRQKRMGLEADSDGKETQPFSSHWYERRMLGLYGLVADYGESWRKLFVGMVASVVAVGTIIAFSTISPPVDTITGATPLMKTAAAKQATCPAELVNMATANDIGHGVYTTLLGLLPFATARTVGLGCLAGWAKLLIAFEGLTLVTLTTLFVMAVRRRFRR